MTDPVSQTTLTMNEQPVTYRVQMAEAEGVSIAKLRANADRWEQRANGHDSLYSLDREACRRFAREDRETAEAMERALQERHDA